MRVAIGFVVLSTVGRIVFGAELFTSDGFTYFGVVASEICAGILVGLVVGALRSYLTSAQSAALVGFLGATVVALIGRVALDGFEPWTGADSFAVLIYPLLIGPAAGALIWYRVKDREERKRKKRGAAAE
ncbi:MAG TPA: hypothetical protein VH539_21210 [Gemmatimonadaceae bacterium]